MGSGNRGRIARPGLWLVLALAFCSACSEPARRPNVLLLVIDTLRKDHLHLYGHPEPLSPAIDALAARGTVFENHFTHASQTVPATLSLLLSQLPAEHGFLPGTPNALTQNRWVYPPELLFLQEVFRDAGYETAALTANPFLMRSNGFDQGFESFATFSESGEDLNRAAIGWLRARQRERPFFLYLHYMDVHQPYRAAARHHQRFVTEIGVKLLGNRPLAMFAPLDLRYSHALYRACVAYQDDLVGELLHELDAAGLRDDTLIVLTADHGEEFGEHGGVGHGTSLYGELVRVPLVVVLPGRVEAGRRVTHLSQHLDVAPTMLSLAGLSRPSSFRGGSIFEPAERVLLEMGPWVGVAADGAKLVWKRDAGEPQLFALSDELDRQPRDDPATTARLRARLDEYLALERAGSDVQSSIPLSAEETERLRALGYVE